MMKHWLLACAALAVVLAAVVAFNGPYHEQERTASACELDAHRFYLAHPGAMDDSAVGRDVQLCVGAKGFRPNSTACPPNPAHAILEQARSAHCYVPQGSIRRLIFFAEDRIRNL
jgi:hypothetical protein